MILNTIIKFLLYFCAFAGTIMFLPGNILLDINPKAFKSSLPKNLNKYNSINNTKVSQFEQIGPLLGPESIASFKGKLVTGSSDGFLYEITSDESYKPLVKLIDDKQCESRPTGRKTCGRPLGLKFDSKGSLFVVEPSFGVFRLDNVFGTKPKVTQVFNIEQTSVLGKTSTFLEDVAIEERPNQGPVLYISDVSTKFSIDETILVLFGSETGRILRYDCDSQQVSVIAEDIFFPNGVEMSANNEAVLFTETASRNVWRYRLKGTDKGTLTKVVTHLPGEPNNIRLNADSGTFWVALLKPRTLLSPIDFDYYIKKPLLRKLVGRVAHFTGGVLIRVGEWLHQDSALQLGYSLRTLNIAGSTMFRRDGGMLLEIDLDGNVLNSVYSDQENLGLLSEVREVPSAQANQRVLYLGSFALPHLRKLVISK